MSLTGGIILFATLWFLVFLIVLQVTMRSQADAGEVTPGTPASAPADARIAPKARLTTIITVILWAIIGSIIFSGRITIYDLDFFHRLTPDQQG